MTLDELVLELNTCLDDLRRKQIEYVPLIDHKSKLDNAFMPHTDDGVTSLLIEQGQDMLLIFRLKDGNSPDKVDPLLKAVEVTHECILDLRRVTSDV